MIRINLNDYRLEKKKKVVNRELFFLFCIVTITIFSQIKIDNHLSFNILKSSENLKSKITELGVYNKKSAEFKKIKIEIKKMYATIKEIENLRANINNPVYYMEKMTNAVIPDKIKLHHFNIEENSLTIKGVAVNEKIISTFIKNLNNLSIFNKVSLQRLKIRQDLDRIVNVFEIICFKK